MEMTFLFRFLPVTHVSPAAVHSIGNVDIFIVGLFVILVIALLISFIISYFARQSKAFKDISEFRSQIEFLTEEIEKIKDMLNSDIKDENTTGQEDLKL